MVGQGSRRRAYPGCRECRESTQTASSQTMKLLLTITLAAIPIQAQTPPRPRITGVSHIALYVHDIEKSRAFYKDFLGFGEPFKLDKPDGSLSLTFIKINDRQYVELFPG